MFYVKPSNVKYTDIAIWIDDNAYKEDVDDYKLFEYIYHIVIMVAHKRRLFKDSDKYDDFSIFASSKIFMRYKDLKQDRIKSSLNYIKNVIYPYKVMYERENYSQTTLEKDGNTDELTNTSLENYIMEYNGGLSKSDFFVYIDEISSVVKEFVSKLPYNKLMSKNLTISCLLTILNQVTLSYNNKKRLDSAIKKQSCSIDNIRDVYKAEKANSTILWHLPQSMYGYVTVVSNEIIQRMASDMASMLHQPMPANINMMNLMLEGEEGCQE